MLQNNLIVSYKHFLQTFKPNAHETARKNEKTFFYKCIFKLDFATINQRMTTKFLKPL